MAAPKVIPTTEHEQNQHNHLDQQQHGNRSLSFYQGDAEARRCAALERRLHRPSHAGSPLAQGRVCIEATGDNVHVGQVHVGHGFLTPRVALFITRPSNVGMVDKNRAIPTTPPVSMAMSTARTTVILHLRTGPLTRAGPAVSHLGTGCFELSDAGAHTS
jgi:hypothetical protein